VLALFVDDLSIFAGNKFVFLDGRDLTEASRRSTVTRTCFACDVIFGPPLVVVAVMTTLSGDFSNCNRNKEKTGNYSRFSILLR